MSDQSEPSDAVARLRQLQGALRQQLVAGLNLPRTVFPEVVELVGEVADLIESQQARITELEAGLKAITYGAFGDEPCRFDHDGYCQAHLVESPCSIDRARKLLAASPDTPETRP